MFRAVLDANVLASAFIRPLGPSGQILTFFLESSGFELILSLSILEEFQRCLFYPRLRKYLSESDEEIQLRVAALGLLADLVEDKIKIQAVLNDPDDNKYLAAALEGRANFVVSGDHHLLDIKEYQGILILTPREFLSHLQR